MAAAAAAAVGQVQLTVSAAATCCQLASKICWLQLSTDSGGGDGGHDWSRVLLSWNMTARSGERERKKEGDTLRSCVCLLQASSSSSSSVSLALLTCSLALVCLFTLSV